MVDGCTAGVIDRWAAVRVPTPHAFDAHVRGSPLEYCHDVWYGKTRITWLPDGGKIDDMFIRFDRIHEGDRRTDRHRMMA